MNSKSSGRIERFARVHNNLVRKDDGLGAVVGAGLTARQLDLVFELIAEAQRRQNTCLEFASRRAADQLSFGRRQRDRKQLIAALRTLSKMDIPSTVFASTKKENARQPESNWQPDEVDIEGIVFSEAKSHEEARAILWAEYLEDFGVQPSKLSEVVPLVRYRRYLDGRLVVRIPRQVVQAPKYFVPAHLSAMRQLRCLTSAPMGQIEVIA